MVALRAHYPDVYFEGVLGPHMVAAGGTALASIDQLSVMGLVEVLGRLPQLLALRRRLVRHWQSNPPDLLVGIDAPDFNLPLEKRLKAQGVATVHYVSPSVWAWRPGRVVTIGQSADRVLTLFPFETDFYTHHQVMSHFVGHPLADAIPLVSDQREARRALGLAEEGEWVALLPGSRSSEIHYLAGDFLRTACWLLARRPGVRFIVPLVNTKLRVLFEQAIAQVGAHLPLTLVDGRAQEVIAAANSVLLASGTAALETLLINRPMVVAYRLAWLSYALIKPLIRVPYYSLPNHLAGRPVVPEFIQRDINPESLGQALLDQLTHPSSALTELFRNIHLELRQGASERAANILAQLLATRGVR